jgi:L-threonylcarbamoyladenylate synthase
MDQKSIDAAVTILRAGGLVVFPTETVYGLGADAANASAVRKIFAAKGRPADHPVIVHLSIDHDLARWVSEIPPAAEQLAERFWPGPLTLILKRAKSVIDEVTGGQDTVGLRVPSHPVAQALLHAFGGGIAAPSANRFGHISPTTARHVREELGDRVDLILDGGPCDVGIESTIVDVSGATPVLLRPGRVSEEEIEAVLQVPLAHPGAGSPRVSGTLPAHYAPRSPLIIASSGMLDAVVRDQASRHFVAVLARRPRPSYSSATVWMIGPRDAAGFAHYLYAGLRQLDQCGCTAIIVEAPPETPDWAAVRDRLGRAAVGSGVPAVSADIEAQAGAS